MEQNKIYTIDEIKNILQNNKKFYCSNLITHIYKKIGIELNEDHFLTTGSDIITNEQTYIIYYKDS